MTTANKIKKEWLNYISTLPNDIDIEGINAVLAQIQADTDLAPEFKEHLIEKLNPFLTTLHNKNTDITLPSDNDDGISYPSYEDIFNDFAVSNTSWMELNPDNLDYVQWLIKVGLPEFWVQPDPELQYPLLAVCAFINSYAIPSWSAKARKEAQLPLIVFSGESRSGKTEGAKFCLQNYHPKRTLIIKADSSGVALRDSLHDICYDEVKERLLPSIALIDNFEHQFLDKWGSFKMLLLSVLKSQSNCSIGSKDGKKTYYSHCLKLFTTVESIKAFNGKQSEFYNRQVFFFTKRQENVKSIGNYNFADIPDYYKSIWSVNNTKDKWFPILSSVLRLDDNSTSCPPLRWSQSLVIIATGIYLGIWGSINEASDFMASYWAFVESKEQEFKIELELIIKAYLDEIYRELNQGHWYRLLYARSSKDKSLKELYDMFRQKPYATFQKNDVIVYCLNRCSQDKKNVVKFVNDYFDLKKYHLSLDEKGHPVYHLPIDIEDTKLIVE